MKVTFRKQKTFGFRAQAIVEFAIALPILLVLLVGLLEVGRMVFIYSAINNASREAVRYASAIGLDDDGLNHYNNCTGIRNMARRSAYFLNLPDGNIDIRYDGGPDDPIYTDGHGPDDATEWNLLPTCSSGASVETGDRVLVTVTATYGPMVNLIPLGTRTVISSSSRTIVGIVLLEP